MVSGRQIIQGDEVEEFWALRNVSFQINQGEVLGIIGRNGAGKSTLLKILSRITEPSDGRITLRGRVASLLEVGTGFHPELTGRENIFLNGAILGMTRVETRRKFEEIVDFAGVEKFLDTPVKRYSSGMYVRLAFAVAAHLEPEILIVDEVLAVGDAEFQRKCLGKMHDVATKEKRTVLFVSHNMGAIRHLCTKVCVLNSGGVRFQGDVGDALSFYLSDGNAQGRPQTMKFEGNISARFSVREMCVNNVPVASSKVTLSDSERLTISIDYSLDRASSVTLGIAIFVEGIRLFTALDAPPSTIVSAGDTQRSVFKLPTRLLKKGFYQVGVGVVDRDSPDRWLWNDAVLELHILSDPPETDHYDKGVINIRHETYRSVLNNPS